MTNKRLFHLFCLLILSAALCACGRIQEETPAFTGSASAETEATRESEAPASEPDRLLWNPVGINTNFFETESCYYWIPIAGQYLQCYDKQSRESFPLCSRPDCLHNTEACNAFLGMVNRGQIAYLDGWFYWIGQRLETDGTVIRNVYAIWKMTAQGTDRQMVRRLDYEKLAHYQIQFSCFDGEAFYGIGQEDTLENESPVQVVAVCRIPLEEAETEVLYQKSYDTDTNVLVKTGGDKIYFGITRTIDSGSFIDVWEWDRKAENMTVLLDDFPTRASLRRYGVDENGRLFVGALRLIDDGAYPGDKSFYYVEEGKLTPFLSVEEKGKMYPSTDISDSCIFFLNTVTQEDGTVCCRLCLLNTAGETLFEGELPLEYRRGLNSKGYGMASRAVKDKQMILEMMERTEKGSCFYLLLYDLSGEKAVETLLFGPE